MNLVIPEKSELLSGWRHLNEDSLVEGNETFNVTLSNPAGAALGAQSSELSGAASWEPRRLFCWRESKR